LARWNFEEIVGFKNETDANHWIAVKFQAWLEQHRRLMRENNLWPAPA